MSARHCPPSATHAGVAWSGLAALLATVGAFNFVQPLPDIALVALLVMAATALGVFVPDLAWQRVQRRSLAATLAPSDWPRVFTKALGLLGCLAACALYYRLLPEYGAGGFYRDYFQALRWLLPPWLLLALPYLWWVDRRLAAPRDALWQLGRALLGRWGDVRWSEVGQYLLGWLVKAFFLPLMFGYFCGDLGRMLHYEPAAVFSGFAGLYEFLYFALFFIDVALVSMTYLCSLRLTDTHIRSTEPSLLGWAAALACYDPFWSLLGARYLRYDSIPWGQWLAPHPWLYVAWGTLILLLVAVYVWATMSFGGRFSNLTHRGIITNGPYRYTRHPAYLAKNLSWWMLAMPFMASDGVVPALRRCALLLCLNALYYLRAKTEERHLALDPVYVEYSAWIDDHGLLRWFNRIPLLRTLARWRPKFRSKRLPWIWP
ncbi:MAG: isoprenylcysteine carboxylmethyltransferase family protein [Steroidobacteraceae bacterium]